MTEASEARPNDILLVKDNPGNVCLTRGIPGKFRLSRIDGLEALKQVKESKKFKRSAAGWSVGRRNRFEDCRAQYE